MATFNLEQVFNLARTGPNERQWMRWAAQTDPHTLSGNPQALQTLLHWKSEVERLCQSPLVQQSITPQTPGLNVPQPRGMSIHDAARRGLYAQPPAQVQQAQVRKGPQAYIQQKPDPALRQAARDLQRSLDELPQRLAVAVQRSRAQSTRQPAQVQKSQVAAPQLPVSPYTGQPSQIRAVVLRSMGEPGGEMANAHPYHLEQQRQAQTQAQKAAHEASLDISPFTGQPSDLTTMVRRSVGL